MLRITGSGWLWFGFALLLGLALVAVGRLSLAVWRLDQSEAEARHAAVVEENLRLALWRMDTALMPLLAFENARLPADPEDRPDLVELVSLVPESAGLPHSMPPEVAREWVQFRFRIPLWGTDEPRMWPREVASKDGAEPESRLASSSQANPNIVLARKAADGDSAEDRRDATSNDGHMQNWLLQLDRQALASRLAPGGLSSQLPSTTEMIESDERNQRSRAVAEFNQRSQSLVLNNTLLQNLHGEFSRESLTLNLLTPLWHDGRLLLARRIAGREGEWIDGSVVNWDILEPWLLESSRDLLPLAELEPRELTNGFGEPGLLAAIPARLLPGTLPLDSIPRRSTTWPTLWLAWAGVATAVLAGGLLLQGVLGLSQRRAAFVSAVTHELRTPLTTFQMYTEMLSQDMVTDPATRREYLETLHDESLRLSHLVENVLAFARLERARTTPRAEPIALAEIVDRQRHRFERRTDEVGMRVVIEEGTAWAVTVRVDPSLVEQILWNLVDNACKYAHEAEDRRIVLSAAQQEPYVEIRVRDFGPGLKSRWGRFQPFSKTAQEAAHSAPGIGLGLALCRRLAKQLGGKLFVDKPSEPGACFVLRLPAREKLGCMPEPKKRAEQGQD